MASDTVTGGGAEERNAPPFECSFYFPPNEVHELSMKVVYHAVYEESKDGSLAGSPPSLEPAFCHVVDCCSLCCSTGLFHVRASCHALLRGLSPNIFWLQSPAAGGPWRLAIGFGCLYVSFLFIRPSHPSVPTRRLSLPLSLAFTDFPRPSALLLLQHLYCAS